MFSKTKPIRMAVMVSKSQKAQSNDRVSNLAKIAQPRLIKAIGSSFFAVVASAMLASSSNAATAQVTDYYATHFFNTATAATYSVWVENPVRTTDPICAMVYVFDSTQTLQECCGCPVRTDQLETFTLAGNLTGDPFGKTPISSGIVDIVASSINHGNSAAATDGCDPAATLSPTPTLRSWLSNDSQGTSDPFLNTPLDTPEQNRLPSLCSSSITIGAPAAICTCPN
jgi:hypothetical protein